ncbi:type I 3-dehydroquinate dehydratase [Fodinisporobacter ferrooxydans]|uniref:3-dehydroquinate dehydratase n=1 Tax=Fodinisporobacter ferrooxydans TaxID=2901836 RepID=A0ABY4CQU3_9BACL|nr:type I 3-dehydroquinate dehydratase [Alicyclobacillaceae bacterium MYW30-H2]
MICTPLIGKDQDALVGELTKVIPKQPDLIEWRVDFFDGIANVNEVMDAAKRIKEIAGNTPILFTRRSHKEGGQPISLSEDEVVELYTTVCASQTVDLIDFELSNNPEHFQYLRKKSLENGIQMVASYHNFQSTPSSDVIVQKLTDAERAGADIGKVAVMPNSLEDVLTLLHGTLTAKSKLNIPVITMSMGGYGSLTRMFGGAFGSAVTFAVGENSSAPGQIPIEDLKTVLTIVQRSMGGN